MRRILVIALVLGAHGLTGWGWHREAPPWPQAGPMPDAPVPVKPYRYAPVTSGAISNRPVAPMPWPDVNRRVSPPAVKTPPPGPTTPGAPRP